MFLQSIYNIFFVSMAMSIIKCNSESACVCTTVQCPMVGENKLIMGNGYADLLYEYISHNDIPVVSSVTGTIKHNSLDKGTDTTSCTQSYARSLDGPEQDCDAGHILANRLGGYGNEPINIFPQDLSINRGSYAQFESKIYDCMIDFDDAEGNLSWSFHYENNNATKPNKVDYQAVFIESNCADLSETFTN